MLNKWCSCRYWSNNTKWSKVPFILNIVCASISINIVFFTTLSSVFTNNKILSHLRANIHCITIDKHLPHIFLQLFSSNLSSKYWYHNSTTICWNVYLTVLYWVINRYKQLISILLKTLMILTNKRMFSSPLQQIVIKFFKRCSILDKPNG